MRGRLLGSLCLHRGPSETHPSPLLITGGSDVPPPPALPGDSQRLLLQAPWGPPPSAAPAVHATQATVMLFVATAVGPESPSTSGFPQSPCLVSDATLPVVLMLFSAPCPDAGNPYPPPLPSLATFPQAAVPRGCRTRACGCDGDPYANGPKSAFLPQISLEITLLKVS